MPLLILDWSCFFFLQPFLRSNVRNKTSFLSCRLYRNNLHPWSNLCNYKIWNHFTSLSGLPVWPHMSRVGNGCGDYQGLYILLLWHLELIILHVPNFCLSSFKIFALVITVLGLIRCEPSQKFSKIFVSFWLPDYLIFWLHISLFL